MTELGGSEIGSVGGVENLVPHRGISLAIFGKAGSGKTTFVRILLSFVAKQMSTIMVDVKSSKVWRGQTAPFFGRPWTKNVYSNPTDVLAALAVGKKRILYNPLPKHRDPYFTTQGGKRIEIRPIEEFYKALCRYALKTRIPFCIATDDTHELLHSGKPGEGSRQLQTLMRELGIIRIWIAQRCKTLPIWLASESQWIYAFRLGSVDDHKYLQRVIGAYPNPPRGSMVYWHEDEGEPHLVNFDIGEAPTAAQSSEQREDELRRWAPSST